MVVLSAVAAIALPELASDPSNGSQTELEVTRRMEGVEIDPYNWASGLRRWVAGDPDQRDRVVR